MQLKFVKMHGLGNDFMLVDWPQGQPLPASDLVQQWGDRRQGVGFDSLLLLERSSDAVSYRVFNADGGEAQQCGNGARCIARYVADNSEDAERVWRLGFPGGVVDARIQADGDVAVMMAEPDFSPASLPFIAAQASNSYSVDVAGEPVQLSVVSMGNPHAVIEVDSVDSAPVGILGEALATHQVFPQGVNVGFVERESESRVRLRVYERGIGETRACGTGAAAAMAVGRRRGQLAETVEVSLPGGSLTVVWPGPGSSLWQSGQTTKVYEGLIEL